ncbi:MAG TPA: radical SAM protein [Pyrinomonadaceae bacterium]|jgi:MoaA/NifB/PqqE/SkfB family radical SAM enzyme|nr:radical SAM protein [Pyrinomonadaceae bacterium]
MKRSTFLNIKLREAALITRALASTRHPVLAHIIPMRRCNLACAYCNEYDKTSDPVPLHVMKRRLDKLADLGTSSITISGGEPMMHPAIEEIVRHTRRRGMLVGLITNGYYMTPDRIKGLNEAGLQYLQISIDNVTPDEVSKKSLKNLDKKLQNLAEHADFHVNINSVIGGGIKNPEDALVIARRAIELGFSTTVGVIHDGHGLLKPLGERERKVYEELKRFNKTGYARLGWFQDNLAAGKPNNWRCRSGGRYLYICEDGLVHYCSQQRGTPGVPVEQYTMADVEREYNSEKWCAPLCTVACAHKVAILDNWRNPQKGESAGVAPQRLRDAILRTMRAE